MGKGAALNCEDKQFFVRRSGPVGVSWLCKGLSMPISVQSDDDDDDDDSM